VPTNHLIVVNSLISPSEPIEVKLSQSVNITEQDTIIYIDNAIVSIYCDDTFQEKLSSAGGGVYKSLFLPEQNKTYKIQVTAEGLSNVFAITKIPPKPELVTLISDSSLFNGFNIRVRVIIKDDALLDNYYYLTLKSYVIESVIDYSIPPDTVRTGNEIMLYYHWKEIEKFSDLLFINNDQTLSGKDGSTTKETIQSILGTTKTGLQVINWFAFSDKNINGTIHTIELYIADNIRPSSAKPIYIELKSINKEYFNYLKSKTYAENEGNNPFSEPVRVYNNINGGAGIFAGFNKVVDSVVPSNQTK
jgi:hypothetical protein